MSDGAGAVLCDVTFVPEVRHLPDGTDEGNAVRIRVTADVARQMPVSLTEALVSAVRSRFPAHGSADGWHPASRCPDE